MLGHLRGESAWEIGLIPKTWQCGDQRLPLIDPNCATSRTHPLNLRVRWAEAAPLGDEDWRSTLAGPVQTLDNFELDTVYGRSGSAAGGWDIYDGRVRKIEANKRASNGHCHRGHEYGYRN